MSFYYIYNVFIITLALNFQPHDCLEWLQSPAYLQNVKVNVSGSVTLSWQYQITSNDFISHSNSIRIKCGCIIDADLIELTKRIGDTGLMTVSTSDEFASRIEIVPFDNSRTVGFKIVNIQKNDSKQYRCAATVSQVNEPPNIFSSGIITIKVLDGDQNGGV